MTDLYQTKVWTTAGGETLNLKDMSPSHRRNTLRFLESRAPLLKDAADWNMALGVWQPPDEILDAHLREPADEWLRGLPLYKALRKLVRRDAMAYWMDGEI